MVRFLHSLHIIGPLEASVGKWLVVNIQLLALCFLYITHAGHFFNGL